MVEYTRLPAESQRREILKQARGFAFLTLTGLVVFMGAARTNLSREWPWWQEVFVLTIGLGSWIAAWIFSLVVRRACKVHLLFALSGAVVQVPYWWAATRYASAFTPSARWVVLAGFLVSIVIGLALFYRNQRFHFKQGQALLEKSGRLDCSQASWNLAIPFPHKVPQEAKQWETALRLLLPFSGAVGMWLSKTIDGSGMAQLFLFCSYFLSYVMAIPIAGHFAMAVELRSLETELRKKILIPGKSSEATLQARR